MVSLINKLVNVKVFVDRYLLNLTVIYTKVNAKMDKKEMVMVDKFTAMVIIISVFGKMIRKMEKEKKFM
jgi:hypothetical protein